MSRELWTLAGEGEHIWFVGALVTIKVPGEAVDGRCTMIEFLMPQGVSPPRHSHPQDETFTMIDGTLTFVAGDSAVPVRRPERIGSSQGGGVNVPSGERKGEARGGLRTGRDGSLFPQRRDARCPSHVAARRTRQRDRLRRLKKRCATTAITTSARQWGRTTSQRRGPSPARWSARARDARAAKSRRPGVREAM